MYNYLNNQVIGNKITKSKVNTLDYFYWKYIYGDLIISKFINFLVKSGYKNRAIRFFFKALFNLKSKFGINPILLIKYIILKRNVLHKVTKKKVKQKTFFYLRLLDFEKQISNTIRKIMELVFFLKEKKQLKLWQSIFIILLNFCILKNKKKVNLNLKYDTLKFNLNSEKILRTFSLLRLFLLVKEKYLSIYLLLKNNIFLISKNFCFFFKLKKYILANIENMKLSELNDLFSFFLYNKILLYYVVVFRLRLSKINAFYLDQLKLYRNKIKRFFYSFKKLKKKYLLNRIDKYRKKKYKKKLLLRNKLLLKAKYKQHFLTRFFFKELKDLKKASKFKNSFLNFKLRNKKKKELSMGTRIHAKHDVRLRHRKIFFRVSKYGQLKK